MQRKGSNHGFHRTGTPPVAGSSGHLVAMPVLGMHQDSSTGSLAQSLANSLSLTSIRTAESTDAAAPKMALPPRTAQTAMGSAAGEVTSLVQSVFAAAPAPPHHPAAQAQQRDLPGTAHLARSLVSSALSGTPAQIQPLHISQGPPAPPPRESTWSTASQPPPQRWVIEEVIDFGPVSEDGTRESSEDMCFQKLFKPRSNRHQAPDSFFGNCLRNGCVDEVGCCTVERRPWPNESWR